MGSCMSKFKMKQKSNVEILDYIPPGSEFNYLRPQGTITVSISNR